MNNNINLKLDERNEYNLLDLEKKLKEELKMYTISPSDKNHLEYDGCEIQIGDKNQLWLQTNYIFADKYGKYLNHGTSDILKIIEEWTKETYINDKIISY